jgi:hypothetical protein
MPLDQIVKAPPQLQLAFTLGLALEQQVHAVEATVLAQQDMLIGDQAIDLGEHAFEEKLGFGRAVLAPGAQLEPDTPVLVAKLGGNRRVAVNALVGAV